MQKEQHIPRPEVRERARQGGQRTARKRFGVGGSHCGEACVAGELESQPGVGARRPLSASSGSLDLTLMATGRQWRVGNRGGPAL